MSRNLLSHVGHNEGDRQSPNLTVERAKTLFKGASKPKKHSELGEDKLVQIMCAQSNETKRKHTSDNNKALLAEGTSSSSTEQEQKLDERTLEEVPKSKPKRPLSAYNLFFRDQREILLRELPCLKQGNGGHGKITFSDLGKKIGNRWKAVSPQEKQRYEEIAAKGRAKYLEQAKAWKQAGGKPKPRKWKTKKGFKIHMKALRAVGVVLGAKELMTCQEKMSKKKSADSSGSVSYHLSMATSVISSSSTASSSCQGSRQALPEEDFDLGASQSSLGCENDLFEPLPVRTYRAPSNSWSPHCLPRQGYTSHSRPNPPQTNHTHTSVNSPSHVAASTDWNPQLERAFTDDSWNISIDPIPAFPEDSLGSELRQSSMQTDSHAMCPWKGPDHPTFGQVLPLPTTMTNYCTFLGPLDFAAAVSTDTERCDIISEPTWHAQANRYENYPEHEEYHPRSQMIKDLYDRMGRDSVDYFVRQILHK